LGLEKELLILKRDNKLDATNNLPVKHMPKSEDGLANQLLKDG
jgi:hypothetical protein